jgi:hypothetical protein
VVEKRIKRTIAVRKVKRFFILSIIAFAIVSPVLVILTAGYFAVNESFLSLDSASFDSQSGQPARDLVVNWHLVSRPAGNYPDPNDLAYRITINNAERLTAACPRPLILYDCVMIPGVARSELNGSTVGFSVTGVVREGVWRQQITRSTSFTCSLLGLVSYCG